MYFRANQIATIITDLLMMMKINHTIGRNELLNCLKFQQKCPYIYLAIRQSTENDSSHIENDSMQLLQQRIECS